MSIWWVPIKNIIHFFKAFQFGRVIVHFVSLVGLVWFWGRLAGGVIYLFMYLFIYSFIFFWYSTSQAQFLLPAHLPVGFKEYTYDSLHFLSVCCYVIGSLVGITFSDANFDLLESAVHEFMPFWPSDNIYSN